MAFVNSALDLPIFLSTRNRIKQHNRETLRKYVQKRRSIYSRKCPSTEGQQTDSDDDEETIQIPTSDEKPSMPESYNRKKFKHILGLDEHRPWCQSEMRRGKVCRDFTKGQDFQLAPNRYTVPTEIMADRKGEGGAHWAKLPKNQPTFEKKPVKKFAEAKYPETPSTATANTCNKYKGVFASNPRERRATSRSMVTDAVTCYRNPSEPGPAHYTLENHTLARQILPPTKVPRPNPHIFLEHSYLPAKILSIHPRHTSFKPAVARYETRYRNIGACRPKASYMPGIQMIIEREKRLKFRRKPYVKIDPKLYYDPEWRHVQGHGFRRLFRKPPADREAHKLKDMRGKRHLDNIQLYPDAAYMALVNFPDRKPLSLREEPVPRKPLRIRYNCISRRIMRKQLRNNKKIAFLSSQERFKDGYRLPPLTYTQWVQAIMSLPEERRLRDLPTTRRPLSEIKPHLYEIPPRMLPIYVPDLRKCIFKFLPIPEGKVLGTLEDIQPPIVNGQPETQKYFNKKIEASNYFTDNIQEVRQKDREERQRRDDQAALELEELSRAIEARRKLSIKIQDDLSHERK